MFTCWYVISVVSGSGRTKNQMLCVIYRRRAISQNQRINITKIRLDWYFNSVRNLTCLAFLSERALSWSCELNFDLNRAGLGWTVFLGMFVFTISTSISDGVQCVVTSASRPRDVLSDKWHVTSDYCVTMRRRHGDKDLHLPPSPTVKVGVRNLGVRFIRKTASWSAIYLWGYFGFSPGWLLAPLILSVIG